MFHCLVNLKLFGSAGVIGNPLGFARSMGLGIRDFLSVPAKSIVRVNVLYAAPFYLLMIFLHNKLF